MGKSGLSMSLKGGRPASGDAMISIFMPPLHRAGLVVQAEWQRNAPVLTGTYRRSVTTSPPQKRGRGAVVYVGTAIVYAHYQNTRTRNRGHIERAVEIARPKAIQVFSDGVGAAMSQMWVGK